MHYRFVGHDNPICTVEDLGSAEADDFFGEMLDPSTAAIVARDGGVLAGWLRFEFEKGVFYPCGTWVESPFRGKGIAQALWGRCMKKFKPRLVCVRTVSVEGRRLVGSLVSWFPKVEFEVRT